MAIRAKKSRSRRKRAQDQAYQPGTVVVRVGPPGAPPCDCPICKALGIDGLELGDGPVVTPIQSREQWDAVQAAYAEMGATFLR
jgi:hypothetical protein